jgi:hypothetical protein
LALACVLALAIARSGSAGPRSTPAGSAESIAGPPARADDIALPNTKAVLHLDAGWRPIAAAGVVVAYANDAATILAITRANVPNPDAWRTKTKQAYAEQIERGVAARVPGYRRVAKKLGDAHGVPALDLEAHRDGGATLVIRILLFRTYALALAIEVPKSSDPATVRMIIASFGPPEPIE